MPFSPDELVFLRTLAANLFQAPLAPDDASKDSILTRKNNLSGAGYVPDDPQFYLDLKKYAGQLGFDPAAMLIVIASESNFYTGTHFPKTIASLQTSFDKSLVGHDVAPRGLIGFTAASVPSLMSAAEWDVLPSMDATSQLAYVAKAMGANLQRVGGRSFSSPYEVYLANASPGAMTASGKYDLSQTLYAPPNDWLDNLSMDHGAPIDASGVPQGDTAYSYAAKHGESDQLPPNASRIQKIAYATPLTQKGVIKGKVTLGDLQKHAERMNLPGWNLAWQLAMRRYAEANAPSSLVSYKPPASKPFTFPSFAAPLSTPAEGGMSKGVPGEPIAVAANGALVWPVTTLVEVGAGVAAIAGILALHFAGKDS